MSARADTNCHDIKKIRVVSRIGIFGRYLVDISPVLPNTIPKENSVSIFGIKTLAGALKKIGGSPLFLKKGGHRLPLCTLRPPFEEKKGIPAEFFKKRVPAKTLKCVPAKVYSKTINNTDHIIGLWDPPSELPHPTDCRLLP